MDEKKEGEGFTVKDRRIFSPDGQEEQVEEESGERKIEQAREEKKIGEDREEHARTKEIPLPEPSFSTFLTFFFFQQAIMFLGEIPNPETQQTTANLPMAKYLIDTLSMIKEKTKGNLTTEEQSQLDTFLTELRMRYVKAVEK